MSGITIRQMLEAGVHFGHQTRFWNPKMAPYIFGQRNKIHIINLEKTFSMFHQAMQYARHIATQHGTVLFVGTKRQARELVAEEAKRAGMPYIDQRWLGGMLTNFKTVRTSVKRLQDMEAEVESGEVLNKTKKEILMFQRDLTKLQRAIGGIKTMDKLPDAIFVIDVGYHKSAITEAQKLNIPLIAVVDSNHSPEGIDVLIPGNDDSAKAITLYLRGMADAILEGKAKATQAVIEAIKEADAFPEANDQVVTA